MSNKIHLEVGEKFPNTPYWPYHKMNGNFSVSLITDDSFCILISLTRLTDNDINSLLAEECKLFLYVKDSVPFIIFRSKCFEIEVTINMSVYPRDFTEKWLKSSNDKISVVLIDSNSKIVKGVKTFELKFYKILREALREQFNFSKKDINDSIDKIRAENTIKEIANKAISYQKLRGNSDEFFESIFQVLETIELMKNSIIII